jgi:hypothetical protein
MRFPVILTAVCFAIPILGQPAIVGSAYSAALPLQVAPGQLITLLVSGITMPPTGVVRAPAGSLPSSLAGISAVFRQGRDVAAPVLEVVPLPTCSAPLGNPCGTLLEVTVQIPFEILTICPLCGRPDIPAYLAIAQNGTMGTFVNVIPLADQVHFLTSCDVMVAGLTLRPITGGLPCAPLAMHGDGKPVTASNPAHSGEELVAYAVGLGQTVSPQTTGQPAATASRTSTSFALDINYRPNALASKPAGPNLTPLKGNPYFSYPTPVFTGATPGFVGLYQINFVVPPAPAGLPPCVDATTVPPYANVVLSNLTVSLGSVFSFDGAGICVQPGS